MQIYADNAATTKMSDLAIEAMLPYMKETYGNPSSLHSIGQEAAEVLMAAREKMAKALGCEAREIYFTSGGSEADNQAIISAAKRGERKGKKHIISTAFEHHAVLHTLKKLEKEGFEVTLLPVGEIGIVNPEDVKNAIKEETCLVTVMYANNEIGTIQPIKEIGEICAKHKVLFHTDAVQAVGNVPINVVDEKIDMLSMSSHKFHGPKGVGALYVRRGVVFPNLIDGGAQERGRRAGTENTAGIVGMGEALEIAVKTMAERSEKLTKIREYVIDGALKIERSRVNGDRTHRLPGNVSLCFEGVEGESLLLMLDLKGVCASSGSACTSGSLDPSHVLLSIGLPHEIAHGSLRLSFSDENTMEDAEYILSVLPVSPLWDKIKAEEKNK